MTEKTFCVICDKDVEIFKVITHGHYDELILSCDLIGRKLNFSQKKEKAKLPYINRTYIQNLFVLPVVSLTCLVTVPRESNNTICCHLWMPCPTLLLLLNELQIHKDQMRVEEFTGY